MIDWICQSHSRSSSSRNNSSKVELRRDEVTKVKILALAESVPTIDTLKSDGTGSGFVGKKGKKKKQSILVPI